MFGMKGMLDYMGVGEEVAGQKNVRILGESRLVLRVVKRQSKTGFCAACGGIKSLFVTVANRDNSNLR